MEFVDILFGVGIFLILIGAYSAYQLLSLSMAKSKDQLKDINIANLWVLFFIGIPIGLLLIYFWF
tara:strand:- start:4602 stop:4796 length:195 start_codon:yes stop_codon:yes gene_type:complete